MGQAEDRQIPRRVVAGGFRLAMALAACTAVAEVDIALREQAVDAMRRAAAFFYGRVAVHGGYVYHCSLDLRQRWGEGLAGPDQIWVQPPGTPTVGMAYLRAFEATGDPLHLQAATAAAEALVYGQLQSGGWTNSIDFNPRGRVALYRNGKGGGRNDSSLDDGQTQAALRFLAHTDRAHGFRHAAIHEAARSALDALLAAQYANGGFPQVWTGPAPPRPVVRSRYPEYDWRTEGRVKEYWLAYTLNDGVCGHVAQVLTDAYAIYRDERCLAALRRLGAFLALAQMPEPQPAWAQQYDVAMQPIWARKFEPPAIAGSESQDAMETLLAVCRATGDRAFLEPIPKALSYLRNALLPDGRLARYYELRTNRPLYMTRQSDAYTLTYDDANLPEHYGWKVASQLQDIARQLEATQNPATALVPDSKAPADLAAEARDMVADLDAEGRWISIYRGERLVGQPKLVLRQPYLSSAVFASRLEVLSAFVQTGRPAVGDPEP